MKNEGQNAKFRQISLFAVSRVYSGLGSFSTLPPEKTDDKRRSSVPKSIYPAQRNKERLF